MPAVSIAIIRDGQLASQRALGVMKLYEKDVLDLDTPLTKYTTRRITADPRIERINRRRSDRPLRHG